MFSWVNSKDKKYILLLVLIFVIIKIAGIFYAESIVKAGKANAGLLFRDRRILDEVYLPEVFKGLGYQWDSIHYVNTSKFWIENFRTAGQLRNFAYLYPLTIMIVAKVIPGSILSALLISNFFSFLAIIAFYLTARIYFNEEKSLASSFAFMFYPSFFVSSLTAYAEPMFLFFAVGSWFFFNKDRFAESAVFAALSLSCRTSGVILILVYLFIYYYRWVKAPEGSRQPMFTGQALWLLIPAVFMIIQIIITKYITKITGVRMESFVGFAPSVNGHYLPLLSPVLQVKYLIKELDRAFDVYMFLVPAIILAVYSKKINPELTIYCAISVFSVMSISQPEVIIGMPRHLLNAWPLFFTFGEILENRYALGAYCSFCFFNCLKLINHYLTVYFI